MGFSEQHLLYFCFVMSSLIRVISIVVVSFIIGVVVVVAAIGSTRMIGV